MAVHHVYHHHKPPAIVMKVGDERPVPLTPGLRKEYEKLFSTQKANSDFKSLLVKSVDKLVSGRARYEAVGLRAEVPWYVIGIMHLMECDGNFSCHLHNGDPLKHKTIHVPKGRPPLESWTWEDSAVDALEFEANQSWDARGLDRKDWSLAAILYRLEAWNGFGSRQYGVPSPYLWSGTQFYKTGKYGADGKWNPKLKSQQVGAAPILKYMQSHSVVVLK